MICVIQRVLRASVTVDGSVVGEIGPGMAVLAAVHRDDSPADIEWTAGKLVAMRLFRNREKHFDLDVKQVGGSILLVSNFTVAASTRHGRRPSLDQVAPPEMGAKLFDLLVDRVRSLGVPVATGKFGADMKVEIVNDGPVTFLVDSRQAR